MGRDGVKGEKGHFRKEEDTLRDHINTSKMMKRRDLQWRDFRLRNSKGNDERGCDLEPIVVLNAAFRWSQFSGL